MSDKVLAKVAGREITEAEFHAYLQGIPREQQAYAANPQYRDQYLDQLISLHMFAQFGEDEKLDETEEYKTILESAKRDILAQLAMRNTLKKVQVTEDEIKDYYEANPKKFEKGATVSAKLILVETEEACKDVLAQIESGAKTFEDAAKEYSTCPSKERGGDLGEFGRGQMVKEFEDAAFAAEIGQIVGPVKTQFGAHLIKVEKKQDSSKAAFDEVRAQIYQQLMAEKQNDAYTAKVEELKGKYLEK